MLTTIRHATRCHEHCVHQVRLITQRYTTSSANRSAAPYVAVVSVLVRSKAHPGQDCLGVLFDHPRLRQGVCGFKSVQ